MAVLSERLAGLHHGEAMRVNRRKLGSALVAAGEIFFAAQVVSPSSKTDGNAGVKAVAGAALVATGVFTYGFEDATGGKSRE